MLGYESANMSDTLGSLFIIILLTAIALLVTALLLPFKRIRCCKKVNGKLKGWLHWNFVIRLIIESSMDLTFTCYFNLKYANFSVHHYGSFINFIAAILLGGLLIASPFFILVFYGLNFSKVHDEKFEKKYGAVYEGLRLKSRSALVYNSYFVTRRCLFMCIALFLYKRVLLQLFSVVVLTLVACSYVLLYRPFEEPRQNRLEVMNEVITLGLIYLCLCFTDLIEEAKTQYLIGFFFIVLFGVCILVHLGFMFKDLIRKLLRKLKAKLCKKRNRKVTPEAKKEVDKVVVDKVDELSEESSEESSDPESSSEQSESRKE